MDEDESQDEEEVGDAGSANTKEALVAKQLRLLMSKVALLRAEPAFNNDADMKKLADNLEEIAYAIRDGANHHLDALMENLDRDGIKGLVGATKNRNAGDLFFVWACFASAVSRCDGLGLLCCLSVSVVCCLLGVPRRFRSTRPWRRRSCATT